MTEPLRIRFVVSCRPERAFKLWTEALGRWWPADHTVSGDPAAIALEGHVGGRIYERARDDTEHVWGTVTRFEPPGHLSYSWHIGQLPSSATDVEVVFSPGEDDTTVIEIEHRGWERLGAEAGVRKKRNRAGWDSLLPHLAEAAASADDAGYDPKPNVPATEGGRT